MIKNPLLQSNYIAENFSKYVKSTFKLKNEKYNKDFKEELDKSTLTKGPYLKLELPFTRSYTINELIERGEFSKLFSTVSNVSFDRALYLHQYNALKQIQKGANIVVTTGTGSGKTESFFYPILDRLLRKIERDKKLVGIQAILLYPMNALVNDQLERLRNHLSTIPEITFGIFTGDTPKNDSTSKYNKFDREKYILKNFDSDDIKPPINELITREEIRETPPNILITNYSMLEYLLVRPKDSSILNSETLKNWEFMVLDEVHTYKGTLATEVSHLLKRLQAFANKSPQFILTSATLGNTDEDKKDIIAFASKLTSVEYKDSDIIYSSRVLPSKYQIKHSVDGNDYLLLSKMKDDKNQINSILTKYKVSNTFDLLSQDRNVHNLYETLKETDTFENVYLKMKSKQTITRDQLDALINLVTIEKKDEINIYDIKYHFLIRTLEGAFISLEPNPKLKISNRQTIDGMWAFEIGACKNCNVMYIMGKEYEERLFRSELDLDENYQNFDDLKVDFYLIKNDVIDSLNEDLSKFEEYTVCSKCGFLFQNNHNGHHECDCGNEYKVELFKIKNEESDYKTNLTHCPVCDKTAKKTGIINSFKLGKDQSTALISQILLKSMDLFNEDEKRQVKKVSLFEPQEEVLNKELYKQFLAFSDSRQQASFFALFFQENQDKFLRKALLLKNLKSSMRSDSVITGIERMIEDKSLFMGNSKKDITPIKNAYISVLLELFKSDGVNSLEGLGLLSFEPDFTRVFENLSEEELKDAMPKIKYEQFADLLCLFTEKFRTTPAIKYDNSGLNYEDRKEYLEYRKFDNYVMLKVPPKTGDKSLKSIIPINANRSNDLTKYLAKTFDLNLEEIEDYLEKIWNMLSSERIRIIEKDNTGKGKINFSSFIIYTKNDKTWYACNKCGNLTTHNINNCCVKGDCQGKLYECNPDELLEDNYYRNEYLEKKIEKIVVQEHTGQLTREKGKEYQKGFKNKNINVLSSSTTFEMGVNIGSLDTVFMRNIPPTNSNYAQRAGRAGRSDESVAFVVTYANHNSHDQIYFNDPVPMIEGRINPPYFKVENNKISIRHIMAFLISYFYRQNNLDDKLGSFISTIHVDFLKYINTHKVKLEMLMKDAINSTSFAYFKDFKWLDEMNNSDSLLNKLVCNVNAELKNFKDAEEESKKMGMYKEAASYKNQIKEIEDMDIVQGLAKYNVIPGYGFPIDVVPLKVYDRIKREFNRSLDLSRDLSMALSEYAPDSEIVVDKNKYTSRYIIFNKEGDLPKYYYYKCSNTKCGKIHVNNIRLDTYICDKCGSNTDEANFIVPNLGFITDEKNKDNTILKPKKTYSSEINYLGSLDPFQTHLRIDDFLLIQQENDDKLLVVNENPFFSCSSCGYSVLNKKNALLDSYNEIHKTFRGGDCSNLRLSKIKLGHIITTDVIKMRINMPMTYEIALSTITAILNGITSYLQIDSNDINGIIVNDNDKFAFVFYDTTYGGAGNVKNLTSKNGLIAMIKRAYESVDLNCCDENVSCPICLRNYKNSNKHKYLKRKYARDTLYEILQQITKETDVFV